MTTHETTTGGGLSPNDPRRIEASALQAKLSVDGGLNQILHELTETYRRHCYFPSEHHAPTLAAWTVHTYLWRHSYTTPYINVTAPERRAGKSRVLEVMELVANLAIKTDSISPAALYRIVEASGPTLLIDEVDTVFTSRSEDHAALRNILNGGYRKGGGAMRVDMNAGGTVKRYSSFCPKVLCGIGSLPDTIRDRSIIVRMQRRTKGETVHPLRQNARTREGFDLLRARIQRVVDEVESDELVYDEPEVPSQLNDRQADCWSPLLTIAGLAGGDWPKTLRAAAVALSAEASEEPPSDNERLLADLRQIFDAERGAPDFLPTATILSQLFAVLESPWGEHPALSPHRLAQMLRHYGVKSSRQGSPVQQRGYRRSDLEDAWLRYL